MLLKATILNFRFTRRWKKCHVIRDGHVPADMFRFEMEVRLSLTSTHSFRCLSVRGTSLRDKRNTLYIPERCQCDA